MRAARGGTQVEGADRETDQCDIVCGELGRGMRGVGGFQRGLLMGAK